MEPPEQLVLDICDPELREKALFYLSMKREMFQDLAPLLWNSYGTIAVLLQEIVSIYHFLSLPTLSLGASNRVCYALALLQCLASHPETRFFFINASTPLYVYPFLNTSTKTKPFEYLRLASLGVIGALLMVDDADVICFLLESEVVPLCLYVMENGSELSKSVATFIVLKMLLDDIGLQSICETSGQLFAVVHAFGAMVESIVKPPSTKLLKLIVGCYLRLTYHPWACIALRKTLPTKLKDGTFNSYFHDDPYVRSWLQELLAILHGEG